VSHISFSHVPTSTPSDHLIRTSDAASLCSRSNGTESQFVVAQYKGTARKQTLDGAARCAFEPPAPICNVITFGGSVDCSTPVLTCRVVPLTSVSSSRTFHRTSRTPNWNLIRHNSLQRLCECMPHSASCHHSAHVFVLSEGKQSQFLRIIPVFTPRKLTHVQPCPSPPPPLPSPPTFSIASANNTSISLTIAPQRQLRMKIRVTSCAAAGASFFSATLCRLQRSRFCCCILQQGDVSSRRLTCDV
jgi:hypothetical protein